MLAAIAVSGTTATAGASPPRAHAALSWVINYCTNSSVNVGRWIEFGLSLKKYSTTDLDALSTAVAGATIALSQADADANNVPAMIATAKPALGYIATASKALDRLGLDYDAMKRAHPFGDNKNTETSIGAALAELNARLKDTFTALATLKSAASAYVAGDRNTGFILFQHAQQQLTQALQGLAKLSVTINQALTQLRTECPSAAAPVPAMSAGQISAESGGGGSQRKSTQGFSALAPKRMKLNHRGTSRLPLTMTIPTTGSVEIALSRGKTLIVALDVSLGARHGTAGLLVSLPRNTASGNAQLTVTFTPGKSLSSLAINLPIQLV
ncbi:MAG TPA: hypothetical protein VMU39_19355 [Solirubrobacteraceae bacterium]|nr:hypothetical protein [Solirubrobacteraceae bacterium]